MEMFGELQEHNKEKGSSEPVYCDGGGIEKQEGWV